MSKMQKLRSLTLDELRVRGSQALAAFAERNNWSSQSKLPSDNAIRIDHKSFGTRAGFFAAFDNPQATINELRRRWPNAEKEIVERADCIAEGRFDLLAFRNLSFGTPIDWHLEPIAGKRAPLVHWSKLNYLDADLFGDKKIIWELNRHQYFITLGQAYWLTGDERYAEIFVDHVKSWMDQNPPKLGVNWASSLEVAFRSISWLWALYFFKNSTALTTETFLQISKFLYLNARHLETYLSTYFSPNTHLTGEALGLFYLGTLLPELSESSRWRNKGLRILLGQLPRHVHPDGVYFEQSSYYHRYTTDFYLHLRLLLNANRQSVPPELDQKLTLLLDHLMYITRPDGTTPLFGDDDGGRLMTLTHPAPNDFRATLSTGAAIFERSDYKFVAGEVAEDTLWLLGPAGVDRLERLPAVEPDMRSVAFHDGGYYVMRDGWSANSNYLLFDCGPHGTMNCGHAHADALSFELAVNGSTMLVDPGTYTYTGSHEMRNWFRSSNAHNTITINDLSSSVPGGPFSWLTTARSECSWWIADERFDYVVGAHDGFNWMSEPITHTRSIFFLKNNYWVVRDELESTSFQRIKAYFHPTSRVTQLHSKENTVRMISQNGHLATLQMAAFSGNGVWTTEQGWVSECYGEKKETPVFAYSVLANGSEELVTFLLPEMAGHKPRVKEIEAIHGYAFEINFADWHDVLLLRESGHEKVETARFVSNFDVTWVRFAHENARVPEEFIVINGDKLRFEDRDLVSSTERIKYRSTRINADVRN
jgi:heparinase II/III-like protein